MMDDGHVKSSDPTKVWSFQSNRWMDEELKLIQQHEQLLKRREALLSTTERYFDVNIQTSQSFIRDIHEATERNGILLQDVSERLDYIKQCNRSKSKKLDMLKNNYWLMVEQVFPVWLEDVQEYEERKRRNASSMLSIVDFPDIKNSKQNIIDHRSDNKTNQQSSQRSEVRSKSRSAHPASNR